MLGFFASAGWLGMPSVQSHNRAYTKKKDACYPKCRKTLPHTGVQPTATERWCGRARRIPRPQHSAWNACKQYGTWNESCCTRCCQNQCHFVSNSHMGL